LEFSSGEWLVLAGVSRAEFRNEGFPSPLHEVSGTLLSTLVVKEVGEEGVFSSHLGGSFVTPAADKGDDVRLTHLIQSQKWLIGFGSSSEMVVWGQGDNLWDEEDRYILYPLGVFPLAMPLDWGLGCEDLVMGVSYEGFEDLTLVRLTTNEEDHHL
jgi:hypothetical protein